MGQSSVSINKYVDSFFRHSTTSIDQKAAISIFNINSKYAFTSTSSYSLTRTQFGLEFEVVAKTKLDSHKAEQAVNHWMLVTDSEDVAND